MSHPKIKEVQADILDDNLSYAEYFDVITNISSVEHVGLAGRYGTTTHTPDGDLIAMKKLRGWLSRMAFIYSLYQWVRILSVCLFTEFMVVRGSRFCWMGIR